MGGCPRVEPFQDPELERLHLTHGFTGGYNVGRMSHVPLSGLPVLRRRESPYVLSWTLLTCEKTSKKVLDRDVA